LFRHVYCSSSFIPSFFFLPIIPLCDIFRFSFILYSSGDVSLEPLFKQTW
jgi:hypothetical protein